MSLSKTPGSDALYSRRGHRDRLQWLFARRLAVAGQRTLLPTDGLPVLSLAPRSAFVDFGAWTLAPGSAWPRDCLQLGEEPSENRKLVRCEVPRAPGVYGMLDTDGELIYIGQSKSLRNRLLSYFTGSPPEKAQRIIAHSRRLVWETAPDEFAALLRELELIRRWRPRFNVRGQPGRRRPVYLVVSRGPGSRVYLAAVPAKGDTAIFGPVRSTRECRQAVHALNDFFQLRTCGRQVPMRFAEQRELFDADTAALCARHDMGTCLAPCAMRCTRHEYYGRVRTLKRFLRGGDLSILKRLKEAMRTAAAAQSYEEAALYRDRWEAVANLHEQLKQFRTARREYSFIYPAPRREGGQTWYFIRRGEVLAAMEEPRGQREASRGLDLVEEIFANGKSSVASAMPDDVEMTLLVAGWFRSHPDELQRTMPPAAAKEKLSASGVECLRSNMPD